MKKNEARTYINIVDNAIFNCYQAFAERIKPLSSEPQLLDFYSSSKGEKNGEQLFFTVGTGLVAYALYKAPPQSNFKKY